MSGSSGIFYASPITAVGASVHRLRCPRPDGGRRRGSCRIRVKEGCDVKFHTSVLHGDRRTWRFFAAVDGTELAPVLEDFGQEVVTLLGVDDMPSGRLQHVTKVFLIDSSRRIRNIYSTGFLEHRIVLRDVETLLMDSAPR